jgi:NADPH:quinone reductase-like Zn-dependent oxidoreductase
LLQVIDYHNEDFAEVFSGTPIDLVYDCVGGYEQWRKGREILSPEGSFVTIVGDSAEALNILELVSKGHNCSSLPRLLLCSFSSLLFSSHSYLVDVN